MEKNNEHTFVVCAYKEIKYLDECVKSLKNQTTKSEIIISTSTPNNFIKSVAKKYDVKLVINPESEGHIDDFCFAYKQANTKYVTLCHQDDVYDEQFVEQTIRKMNKVKNSIIAFTNYNEIRGNKIIKRNTVLLVKRLLNFPLKIFKKSKKVRLFILSLGNSISAPTVTYNKEQVDKPIYECNLKANIDWYTWIELAKKNGEFIYISKPLISRRIHEESLTTTVIQSNIMKNEDYQIFSKFWSKPMAKILTNIYSTSEKSNKIKNNERENKMKFLMLGIYLILTISGLILYKYGTNQNFSFIFNNKTLELKMSLISIIGLICYLCSFIIYMLILPKFNISYIMPIVSGISYIGILILSIIVLKEQVSLHGLIGAGIILLGITIMNI